LRGPLFLRGHAEREATWFFRELGGKVPQDGDLRTLAAAAQIDAWLRAIPPFHRGALALRFVPRAWPTCIAEAFGELASVVVRLECALHPAVGVSTETLEHASVERLRRDIACSERARARRAPTGRDRPMTVTDKGLSRLLRRAHLHVENGLRALARARGNADCVVPYSGTRAAGQ
jgi:hypothetical protein